MANILWHGNENCNFDFSTIIFSTPQCHWKLLCNIITIMHYEGHLNKRLWKCIEILSLQNNHISNCDWKWISSMSWNWFLTGYVFYYLMYYINNKILFISSRWYLYYERLYMTQIALMMESIISHITSLHSLLETNVTEFDTFWRSSVFNFICFATY